MTILWLENNLLICFLKQVPCSYFFITIFLSCAMQRYSSRHTRLAIYELSFNLMVSFLVSVLHEKIATV